jgi:transcriptional regulator with XRE-family HTH domain
MNDIAQAFGAVLQRHRAEKGVSQEELAHLANIDRTFVSRLERGARQPTITTLMHLGQALDVSAADLVRETETQWRLRGA